jgi:Zn finger protein HypA/HybF involved in hydrogenase expression
MRRSVSVFVATLASVASVAGSSEPKSVALGESFQLKVGESAQIEAAALQIGFEEVSGDSRCPKGEQCIWEGDATVRVCLQKASETKETHELHTAAKEQSEVSYLGYEVKLLGLAPYPISGRSIEPADYVVTLEVTGEASAP